MPHERKIDIVNFTNQDIQSAFRAKPDKSINIKQAKEHFKKYPERWNTIFKFLTESSLNKLPLGRIDLNENVYVFVCEYEPKNLKDANYESHQKLIDLQYLIEGKEQTGLTNGKNLNVVTPIMEKKI